MTKDRKLKDTFNKEEISFLETYLNNTSPTTAELEGQKKWLDYLKPYLDDYFVDAYGSVAGIINPGKDLKVVIEAHADEIAWFVNYITEEGYIYVARNGGSDHLAAPSKAVNIHGEKGIVRGVFGWPAIHTRKGDKEETPKLKNIFVDCGCSTKEEVEALGIHPGTIITFDDPFEILNDKYFKARALDNRIGGFMIAQVAKKLKENNIELPFSLYVVNCVQEEIGLRGAEMMANRIKPDVAIVTDVCHDTWIPMVDKQVEGDTRSGKGPVLSVGSAVHPLLFKHIVAAGNKAEIPIQRRAASRGTGTDTDAFAYSNSGVPSALISLPIKYMHTTVEMTHYQDVESTIDLIFESLKTIKGTSQFSHKL